MDLQAGRDYPQSYAQLRAWFGADWKCLDYVDWLRWPEGFVCPHCGGGQGWQAPDRRWRCGGCDRRVSATAGTIFHKTRTPLTVWFAAAWLLVSGKSGVSASHVRDELGLGSYQTAWAMLHRYRQVMVLPGRDRLTGEVEVDESYLGGPEAGVPGRGALGKVLFVGAVERTADGRPGRARLAVIDAADVQCLRKALHDNVEPGAQVITDGWRAYPGATREHYRHTAINVSATGQPAHLALPAVHLVFSLVKRWIMGTLQGSVSPEHLQTYLDEWVFRFNRRSSASRGLLFYRLMRQAAHGPIITYDDLRKADRHRPAPQARPTTWSAPPSLDLGDVGLPWRSQRPDQHNGI